MAFEMRFVDQECVDCHTHFMRKILASSQKRCADCQRTHQLELKRAYSKRPDQREKAAASKRRRYAADPERFRARVREWRAEHKDYVSDYNRRYGETHRELLAEKQRRFYAAHSERVRAWSRRYRLRNYDRVMARQAQYRRDHADQLNLIERLKRRVRNGDNSAKLRLAEARGKQTYCTRLHLRAYPLPCGNYPSCNHCPSCPKEGVRTFAWKDSWE